MPMIILNAVIGLAFVLAFLGLTSGRLKASRTWSAMITPMASIIGSGFLVSAPLLASAIGIWAIAAMAGLVFIAYLVGIAIRYNIQYGEPVFGTAQAGRLTNGVENGSQFALIFAYFISVSYYLVLLASFGMTFLQLQGAWIPKVVPTALIGTICLVGAWRGLTAVERAERWTVAANLAAIAAIFAGLIIFDVRLPGGYGWSGAHGDGPPLSWDHLRLIAGLLIVVQGFETSRFMGELYDAPTRITAMRRAQIYTSIIYLVFFALLIPLYPYFTVTTDVAAFITVIARVSLWLPVIVTLGAVASQLSASVADSIGASGLIAGTSRNRINTRSAYLIIGAVAIGVIWLTDVTSIVALASRAFALFYALQCVVAASLAHARRDRPRMVSFAALALMMFGVSILGVPAGG